MQAQHTLKAVIFDLDGTLVDTIPIIRDIVNAMLAERGSTRQISYEGARPFASFGGLALVTGLLDGDCGDPEAELRDFRTRYAARPTPPESLFAGADRLLARLREAGLGTAVCSNKPQHLCEKVLADLGLKDQFDAIVGSASDRPPKPAPYMLDAVLGQLGVPAAECLLVGDSEVDVALAATRSMTCLFVSHGYGNAGETFPAHRLFDDLAGVEQAIFAAAIATDRSGASLAKANSL